MSNATDVALTLAAETTYGTPVTVTKSFEFLKESLTFRKKVSDSASYRYGSSFKSSAGRVIVTTDAGGDVSMELGTVNFGVLWKACLGAATSTKDGATNVYQQVHTIGSTLPSLTVQKVLPSLNTDGTFSDAVYTFTSAMVSKWSLNVPNAGVATLDLTLDARDVLTTTAKVTPAYGANNHVLHFGGACLYTGTLTAPTATVAASATTAVANVKDITIECDNALATDKTYYFCGAGKKSKPWKGVPQVTGKMTVEFVTNGPFVAAFLADTAMTLLLNLRAMENDDEKVQVALSEIRIEGDLPQAGGTPGVIEMTVPFTAYANGVAAQPIWIVNRTFDSSI